MEIIVPGHSAEFNQLFTQAYKNNRPTYFRLSEQENRNSYDVDIGKAVILKNGSLATVIAVGPLLETVLDAVSDLDVTIIYYTSVVPFDGEALRAHNHSNKFLLCEPYYSGALAADIINSVRPSPIRLESIGVPTTFLRNYGTRAEHDKDIGLTQPSIRAKLLELIND